MHQPEGGSHGEPPYRKIVAATLIALLPLFVFTDVAAAPLATTIAAFAIVLFGLPHGAFDLNVLVGDADDGLTKRLAMLAAYLGMMAIAGLVWIYAPAAALLLFMIMAAIHFGEDWDMIEPGLMRHAAGFSIIAVVTLTSPDTVEAIFAQLAGPVFAQWFTRAFYMVAPVAGLMTIIALVMAVQSGHVFWAVGQGLALVIAMLVPPVVGFAVYFVIVHSMMHLTTARRILAQWPISRFLAQGLVISGVCGIAALGLNGWHFAQPVDQALPVLVFQILAILTVPHLLLTHGWLPLPRFLTSAMPRLTGSV